MASEISPQVNCVYLGTVDPSGSPEYFVGKAPAACKAKLLKCYVVNATARAKHGTDYNTFTLNRIRAAVATAIGSGSTEDIAAGTALADMVPFEITLTSEALSELNAGDVLQMVFTEGAADLDLTECSVICEWVPGTGKGL